MGVESAKSGHAFVVDALPIAYGQTSWSRYLAREMIAPRAQRESCATEQSHYDDTHEVLHEVHHHGGN
jgi:hypothetical protein